MIFITFVTTMDRLSIADRLQMTPMLHVALMLVVGIVVARGAMLPPWVWLVAATVATIIAGVTTVLCGRPTAAAAGGGALPRLSAWSVLVATLAVGGFLTARSLDRGMALPEGMVEYTGVIASQPREYRRSIGCEVEVVTIGDRRCPRPLTTQAYFSKDDRSQQLMVGDGIRVVSRLLPADSLPADIMARTYIPSYAYTGEAVDMGALSLLQRSKIRAMRWRRHLVGAFAEADIGRQRLAVLAALTLGDKSLLLRQTRDDYARAGASHILALSGMHLTIIYTLLMVILGGWRAGRNGLRGLLTQLFIVVSLWCFVILVGMTSSVTRAATMISVYSFCLLLHRDRLSVNTLAFAAAVLLVADPLSLYDIGFQLSFMAMLAITALFTPLCSMMPAAAMRVAPAKWLLQMTILSLAAQGGTAPLVAYYFGAVPLCGLLSNIIVVAGATVLLYGAALFMVLTPAAGVALVAAARGAVATVLSAVAGWMNGGVVWVASLPGCSWAVRPGLLQVVLVYAGMAVAYVLVMLLVDITARRHGDS